MGRGSHHGTTILEGSILEQFCLNVGGFVFFGGGRGYTMCSKKHAIFYVSSEFLEQSVLIFHFLFPKKCTGKNAWNNAGNHAGKKVIRLGMMLDIMLEIMPGIILYSAGNLLFYQDLGRWNPYLAKLCFPIVSWSFGEALGRPGGPPGPVPVWGSPETRSRIFINLKLESDVRFLDRST